MNKKLESRYPRELALRVLTRVLSEGQPLDEVLASVSGEVEPPARGWLQDVCSGTLRWKGRLDLAIDSTALKKKPTGWLRKVLLVTAYQLIVQERTAQGRVVSETVDLVKRKEGEAPARFVNAALRRISEHSAEWREAPFPARASVEEQARWASLPVWLWKRLLKEQGEVRAREFAQACLERPSLWIRSRDPESGLPGAESGGFPGAFRLDAAELPPGPVHSWPGFKEGAFVVQDVSSQVLIEQATAELGQAGVAVKGARALDLCAAPGGKSVGLAWAGFQVTASDAPGSPRMALLRQTVERAAPAISVVDGEKVAGLDPFELVWVDAPCTGSGILRRHPDVRWLREERELSGLAQVQAEVLRKGWERVKPGGYLLYSVCSVLEEEGAGRLKAVGLENAELVRSWNLWPFEGSRGDGFQGFLIRKKA